jgi:hypothetical protein
MTLPPDIIERALRLIKPKPEQKAACAMITERVALLRRVHLELSAIPSPGELKEQFKDIAADLRRIKQLLEPSTHAPALLWKTAFGHADSADDETGLPKNLPAKAFLDELDWLIETAEFLHGAIGVRPGSHRWDNVKAVTAKLAAKLLMAFGAGPLTKTRGGAYYRLATLLYKGVTGTDVEVGAMEQYCRDVLDKADERGGGRIEPSLVVQAPFGGVERVDAHAAVDDHATGTAAADEGNAS